MARACTVCSHPDAVAINEQLIVQRVANRRVAAQHKLSEQAIRRHREHIPQLLVKAAEAEEIAQADTLLERLEDLHRRTEAILDEVEDTDLYGVKLSAIREMRHNLEVIGEVTKELQRGASVSLNVHPEWVELRTVIIGALDRHPEARQEVLQAVQSVHAIGGSNGHS